VKKKPFAGSKKEEDRQKELTSTVATNGAPHWINFLDAIRAEDDKKLHCDIHEGYLSSCLPHLSNISYRLGRELTFDGGKEKFVNDAEADALLTRKYREPLCSAR
jgi:hypothetical protein